MFHRISSVGMGLYYESLCYGMHYRSNHALLWYCESVWYSSEVMVTMHFSKNHVMLVTMYYYGNHILLW